MTEPINPILVDYPSPSTGAETEEQKRQRLMRMPPAVSAQPKAAPDRTVMPPLPSSAAPMRPNASAVGATSQPSFAYGPEKATTDANARAIPAPEIDRNVMPPIPGAGLKIAPGEPAKPASFSGARSDEYERIPGSDSGWRLKRDSSPEAVDRSTMPPIPQSGAEKREQELRAQGRPGSPEGPDLPWWKRALDTVAQIHPIGRTIERNIPGSPGNFDWELARATAAGEQERGATKEKQGIETSASQAQFNTPEKRRAYMAQHPDEFQDVSDFQKNDFILAGKFPQKEPAAPKETDKKIDEYTNKDQKRVQVLQRPDGSIYERSSDGQVFEKPEQDANKLAGEIEAQVGPKPTTAQYGGKTYPSVAAAQKAWGHDAETIKNREAGAGREVLNQGKAVNVLRRMSDGTTQLVGIHPDELKPGDVLAGAGAGMQTMSKEAQFQEIHSGIDNLRSAIKNLDKPFTPEQIGKLTLAMKHSSDPGVFRTELETIIGTQELTPAQEDLVIWMGHLNERALSLRNIAGMGQGSDSMRSAIQAILPGVKSGSTQMMNKQLAAFENQVTKLEKGVPKMPGDTGGKDLGAAPTGKADGSTGTMKVDGKDVKVVVRGGRIVEQ